MNRHLNLALKLAIAASGRKQQRIADLARVDRTKLSHLIAGRRRATPEERQRLASVLGVPVGDLFPPETEAACL